MVVNPTQKLSQTKSQLSSLSIDHSETLNTSYQLQQRVESLSLESLHLSNLHTTALDHSKRLEQEIQRIELSLNSVEGRYEEEKRERELDQVEWGRQRREEEKNWSRADLVREATLRNRNTELETTLSQLSLREKDLEILQKSFNQISLGEEKERMVVSLELERMRRDWGSSRRELESVRLEMEKRESELREEELVSATLVRSLNLFLETRGREIKY